MTRALAAAVVATALLAAAPAQATLVYTKNIATTRPSVWVANTNGTSPKRLVTGRSPHLSPDGKRVAYVVPAGRGRDPQLRVIPRKGGKSRLLMRQLLNVLRIEWSSDSRYVLAVGGPGLTTFDLRLIDVTTGTSRKLSHGVFYGYSFSPDAKQVVFSRAPQETQAISSDLYVVGISGGTPKRIPTNNPPLYPRWGPQNIVFSQAELRTGDAPVYQLHRINPDGTGDAVITRTKVPRLVWGLTPTEFAADGSRLLAQFGGQDTSYAVAVNPATGAERVLGPRGERGLIATAISKDGKAVLAASGGYDETGPSHVVTIPYAGGKTKVLVRNADEPDWNR